MNHLGQMDWARVSGSIRELYAQVTWEGLRKRLLDELLLLVPCDYGSYNEFDFRQGKSVVHLAADAPEITRLLPVFQLHIAQDPHVTYTERTGDCSARQVIDVVTQRQFREHPIYRDFYRHIEVEHRAAFFFQRRGTIDIAVALLRRRSCFQDREMQLMETLRPHLEQAYFNTRRFELANAELVLQGIVLDQMPCAMVLLDSDLRVLCLSGRADQWLRQYFPNGSRTAAGLPEDLRRWMQNERARFAQPRYQAPALPLEVVQAGSRLCIQLTVRPDGRLMLVLNEERFGASSKRLEELGLTPREAEVLHWLCEGKTNPEIGQLLGTSRRTVDKHVEHILAKLGVETRSAAARVAQAHSARI
jgi:DNA-binding CsgD family transcriptional regulator